MFDTIRKHPSVIGFIILFLATFIGFVLIQQNADADRERAYQGGIAICQSAYDSRQAIIRFVNSQTQPTPVPPEATPAEAEQIKRTNDRRANVRKEALDTFGPPPCVEALHLKVTDGGELVPA